MGRIHGFKFVFDIFNVLSGILMWCIDNLLEILQKGIKISVSMLPSKLSKKKGWKKNEEGGKKYADFFFFKKIGRNMGFREA